MTKNTYMLNFAIVKENLEKTLNQSSFIKNKEFKTGEKRAILFYSDGLTDVTTLDDFVIRPLINAKKSDILSFKTVKTTLVHAEVLEEKEINKAILRVFDGDTLLLIDEISTFIIIACKKWDKRSIQEPPTSTVIKGPREGFTEDIIQNVSLLKRKLKTPALKFDFLTKGKYSRTIMCICYLDEIVDLNMVEKVKKRLEKIEMDGILDSSYLRQYLQKRKFSIFRQVGDTEKPDILSAKLLEGRIGIIVDGSPIALTLPYLAIEDFQAPDDYYTVPYRATFVRVLRFIAMILGVLMPGLYVAAQTFHIQFIPVKFLMTIASAVQGIPLSPNIEMLFTLFIFEVLNEASIRMPRYVGVALSVVGALVLGDTAVNAGIISTPTILIMALSGIAVYLVPDQRNTLSILRLIFLILCGAVGIIGFISGIVVISIYLLRLTNYHAPFLAPYAPYIKNDLQDALTKTPITTTNDRPQALKNKNKTRLLWKD